MQAWSHARGIAPQPVTGCLTIVLPAAFRTVYLGPTCFHLFIVTGCSTQTRRFVSSKRPELLAGARFLITCLCCRCFRSSSTARSAASGSCGCPWSRWWACSATRSSSPSADPRCRLMLCASSSSGRVQGFNSGSGPIQPARCRFIPSMLSCTITCASSPSRRAVR